MSVGFHTLTVAEVVDETSEARSIRFAIPPELDETFRFRPGQHLTLKADVAGEELRRNYSLCVAPQDDQLMVTATQTLVLVDLAERRPAEIPDAHRALIRSFEGEDLEA